MENEGQKKEVDYTNRIRKEDWYVADCSLNEAKQLVIQYHYAKGGSNTRVYTHGLYCRKDGCLYGVAWWLPPTRVACESVNKKDWKKVLSLTRMVIMPGVPKNSASFLLARSIDLIRKDGRFVSLVTYADEWANHTGNVYKACNWKFIGKTAPTEKWIDPVTGRQVAKKSTRNRSKSEMIEKGFISLGYFCKFKYVLHLGKTTKNKEI